MKKTLVLALFLLTLLIPLSTRASDFAFKKIASRPHRGEVDPEAIILDLEGNIFERDALCIDLENVYAAEGTTQQVNFRKGLNPKNTC